MKRSLLLFFLAATPAQARPPEAWQFVYVTRSSDLKVTSGHALLTRTGNQVTGELTGQNGVKFSIQARLVGDKVTAEFGSLESDDGGTRLDGTFRQSTMPAVGGNSCWQTFQLSDGYSSLALARNAPQCEQQLPPSSYRDVR